MERQKESNKMAAFLFNTALVLVFIGLVAGVLGYLQFSSDGLAQHLGEFGSYLQGTVGSLWALAGFFIICGAFIAQREQVQQQELQLQEQKAQFLKQEENLRHQNFETFFFQLLNLFNETVNNSA